MASQIPDASIVCLIQPFVQAYLKETNKAPVASQRLKGPVSNAENISIWWRHQSRMHIVDGKPTGGLGLECKETVSSEDTFCDTVQVPSGTDDMELN